VSNFDVIVVGLPQANGALKASDECLYTDAPGHGFKFASVMGEIIAGLVQGRRPGFDLSMYTFIGLSGIRTGR